MGNYKNLGKLKLIISLNPGCSVSDKGAQFQHIYFNIFSSISTDFSLSFGSLSFKF